jgi:hypothetical protein
MIPIPTESPPTATAKQRATLKALLKVYPTGELEWPTSWEWVEKKLNLCLAEMLKRKEIDASTATTRRPIP